MTLHGLFLWLFAAGVTWVAAVFLRRHAVRMRLVQAPNHRSSHARPTPQGGGAGIVLAGVATAVWLGDGEIRQGLTLLSLLIAVVGFWDDIAQVSAKLRFAVQLLASGALIWLYWSPAALSLSAQWVIPGLWLAVPLTIANVWWINLFNFMDGIDGIAATQCIFMLLGAAALGVYVQPDLSGTPVWQWMIALAAASFGFLCMNWPPAKIFMGDVGSTYLAFVMFGLVLISTRAGWMTYSAWAILAAAFVTDATVTLVRRMASGQRWSQAHRSHAYQRLSRRWGSHKRVTLLFVGLNVFWLLPLAWLSLAWPEASWACLVAAYAPLIVTGSKLGAGRPDHA